MPSLGQLHAATRLRVDPGTLVKRPSARHTLEPFNARTITSRPALLAELARVRRRGWARANPELQLGFVAVGAAVLDQRSRPIAAIGIGGLALRLSPARLAALGPRVKGATAHVSAALDYRGGA